MRSGASHPGPHQTWVPAPCLSHRGSGAVTASARQPSQRVPHVAEAAADAWCCNHVSATAAWPAALPACKQVGGGGRNARATSFALARSFWKFSPRQFAFENHRLPLACRNHPASSGTLTFRCTHSHPSCWLRAIQKRHPIVKKLWTMRLPCGIVRKTKN